PMRTESADDAIDGSEMLHLHPPPLPVQVHACRVLGDDAVESGALVALKPLCRLVWGTGLRRDADRAIDADHVEKVAPAHVERLRAEIRVAVAEDDRAKAVPLRLVDPASTARDVGCSLGEHRLERWSECQRHRRGSLALRAVYANSGCGRTASVTRTRSRLSTSRTPETARTTVS